MSEFVRIIDPSGKTLRNDLYNSPPDAASYIIFKDGGLIKAKNGRTGQIEFSGSDAATVIQSALNALTNGGTIFLKDYFSISSPITITNKFVRLVGDKFWRSGLKYQGSGYGLIIESGRLTFENLEFYGGVELRKATDTVFRRCHFAGTPGGSGRHNVYVSGSTYSLAFINCLFEYASGDGLHVECSDGYLNNLLIQHCMFSNIHGWQVNIVSSSGHINRGITLMSNWFEATGEETGLIRTFSVLDVFAFGNVFAGTLESDSDDFVLLDGTSAVGFTLGAFVANRFWVIGNCRYSLNLKYTAYLYVAGNLFSGTPTANIYVGSASRHPCFIANAFDTIVDDAVAYPSIYIKNPEYVTENSGTATIPAGSTSVTVNHGLADTPTKVLVTPIGDPGGRFWVANITSTSFDIVVATAPVADIDFCWQAEV